MAFLMLNWTQAAPFAYKMYLEAGRGAFVILGNKADHAASNMPAFMGNTPAAFLPLSTLREFFSGDPLLPRVTRMVAEYDPEMEVIFVILRDDGGASVYRLGGGDTPKFLYYQHNVLNPN